MAASARRGAPYCALLSQAPQGAAGVYFGMSFYLYVKKRRASETPNLFGSHIPGGSHDAFLAPAGGQAG